MSTVDILNSLVGKHFEHIPFLAPLGLISFVVIRCCGVRDTKVLVYLCASAPALIVPALICIWAYAQGGDGMISLILTLITFPMFLVYLAFFIVQVLRIGFARSDGTALSDAEAPTYIFGVALLLLYFAIPALNGIVS